jgi:hypothetical protein
VAAVLQDVTAGEELASAVMDLDGPQVDELLAKAATTGHFLELMSRGLGKLALD